MNQQFVIVWSALAISQVIYLSLPAPPRESPANLLGVFPLALGVVAFAESVGMVALLRIRAFNPIQTGRLDPLSQKGVTELFTTLILAWMLAESIAIYGLVLRFLGFGMAYSSPFAAAGAFLLFLGRPWQAKLRKPVSSADLARSGTPLR